MFFKNVGTATNATYIEMTGANSLFNAVDVGAAASPIFVDVDRDGDQVSLIQKLKPTMPVEPCFYCLK